jgi:hypothetical protein
MTEDLRLNSIEKKLDAHGETLCAIKEGLFKLAVQSEQISTMQINIDALWKKHDSLIDPQKGVLPKIQQFQAACPKETLLKSIFCINIPIGLALLALSVRVFFFSK